MYVTTTHRHNIRKLSYVAKKLQKTKLSYKPKQYLMILVEPYPLGLLRFSEKSSDSSRVVATGHSNAATSRVANEFPPSLATSADGGTCRALDFLALAYVPRNAGT